MRTLAVLIWEVKMSACVSNGEWWNRVSEDLADLVSVELRKEEHGSRQGETCRQTVDKEWKLMVILSLKAWWIWDRWFEAPYSPRVKKIYSSKWKYKKGKSSFVCFSRSSWNCYCMNIVINKFLVTPVQGFFHLFIYSHISGNKRQKNITELRRCRVFLRSTVYYINLYGHHDLYTNKMDKYW